MKKLLLIASLCISSFADINVAIENMLGSADYNTHKNLINHIFSNKNSFYSNNEIDYTKISQELTNNNLLKLNLPSTQEIEVVFKFSDSPKKSIKNINDILRAISQFNYAIKEEAVVDGQLKWTIKLKTAAAINPLRLSQELQNANSRIVDIKREGNTKWSYSIDTSNSTIYKAEDMISNRSLSLKKPVKPYIIKVSNIGRVTISPSAGNNWYPNVVFYDNNFNVIEVIEKDSLHKSLKLNVPNNTKYIKIDDLYSLANLKQGLNITKE